MKRRLLCGRLFLLTECRVFDQNKNTDIELIDIRILAGAVGIEPTALGFGDRCSTS